MLIKQFVRWECDAVVLRQLNPPEESRIPRAEVLECHLIVGVDCRADRLADLVDEPGPQKRAVGFSAAFKQQKLDPELAVKNIERQRKIELPGPPVGSRKSA